MTFPTFHDEVEAIRYRITWREPLDRPILFYGSSSVRLWERMCEDLGSLRLINAGIGGGSFRSGLFHLERILDVIAPHEFVIYFGSNDIGAFGLSAEETLADQQRFHQAIRAKAPEAQITYLTPVPGPARWIWIDEYKRYNEILAEDVRSDPKTRIIDVASCLMGANDLPYGQHFRPDGIHLEPSGYMQWSNILRTELPLN
ncbi:GDSL-type esterase/lipase family protein [Aestuariicoccus sp. MJ-SS9]|uniref:GDSL-type esterase/lipase family protein n=1 Tax=Aestuariicoccus sp. MJ-SS9 TaxID=3079855 RepID=UPI00290A93D9|nr:GDSL-type esterase/lipase family protein [Aestuariicoccus sp. MJ-SS9]MDU8913404.1 GDSL-type esterase/lipase family protein [Aestuariicoccus sp. MJ-SS9]